MRPGTVTPTWISNTLLFAAPLGILAAGQTLVMLTGGIDLSVASVATGSAYLLATNASQRQRSPRSLIGLSLGLVVGLVNGIGIAVLRVQPLVMTLGTGLMTAGRDDRLQPEDAGEPAACAAVHPDCSAPARSAASCRSTSSCGSPLAVLMIFGLSRSGFGRLLYAIGDNREACQLAGIRVWQVLLVDYVLCGLLAAIAGLVLVGGTNAADLSLADVYLLPSVAAVIIGGTSIFGGRGGYAGSIVGALILTVLTSLLTLLDAPEPIKQILYGAIILLLAAAYTRLTD